MILGPLARPSPQFLSNFTGNNSMMTTWVQFFKLLGITFSHNINWQTHIDVLISKASSWLHFLLILTKAGLQAHHLRHFAYKWSDQSLNAAPQLGTIPLIYSTSGHSPSSTSHNLSTNSRYAFRGRTCLRSADVSSRPFATPKWTVFQLIPWATFLHLSISSSTQRFQYYLQTPYSISIHLSGNAH